MNEPQVDLAASKTARPLRSVLSATIALALIGVLCASCVPRVPTAPPAGAAGPSEGCGVTSRGAVTERSQTLWVNGRPREFLLTVPPAHTPGTTDPVPLVLDFHGLIEGSVRTHPFATQFSELAKSEGFAVAYPIGSADGLYWDVSLHEGNPDLKFIDSILGSLERTMCIDRSRIYVTGLSFGAAMTSMLMCMRSNTFAAAAPVAGMMDLCNATERPVPFVTFHGTADWILPFQFYEDTPGAVASKYGCGEPTTEVLPRDPATWLPIEHTTWDCSAVDSAAEFYVIRGGGHSWPGSEFFSAIGFIVGPTAASLDGTQVIWDFFKQHSLQASTG